jgi:hypothetical protein
MLSKPRLLSLKPVYRKKFKLLNFEKSHLMDLTTDELSILTDSHIGYFNC